MWVNPLWELSDLAVEKLVDEPPAEFVVLGVNSNKAWARTMRDMGCEERIVPKTGGEGFFTQLLSDGNYRDLPFPTWDLVAFYGKRDLVLKYKDRVKHPPHPRAKPSSNSSAVHATTSTPTSTSKSNEHLNVNYALGVETMFLTRQFENKKASPSSLPRTAADPPSRKRESGS